MWALWEWSSLLKTLKRNSFSVKDAAARGGTLW